MKLSRKAFRRGAISLVVAAAIALTSVLSAAAQSTTINGVMFALHLPCYSPSGLLVCLSRVD